MAWKRNDTERKDVYQIIADRIMEQLGKGEIPWRKPWNTSGATPKNYRTKKPYRGVNVFLLACRGYSSPYWLTFKQAKEKGGHVRKGEKGTPVIFWKIISKPGANEGDPERHIPLLRYYTVFNVEQCEGIEAPEHETPTFEHDPIEEAERIVREMPERPSIEHDKQAAYYKPTPDTVGMPNRNTFEKVEEYYSTIFHELTHATGHGTRLAREGVVNATHFGSTDYSKEELVAEMGAAFLCGHCGIEQATLENSTAYIQGWLRKLRNEPKWVVLAAAAGQKAADFILGASAAQTEQEDEQE
jgi:antirestriction protein ArdC